MCTSMTIRLHSKAPLVCPAKPSELLVLTISPLTPHTAAVLLAALPLI